MLNTQPLDFLPISVVYLLTVVMLLLAFEVGYRTGVFVQKRWPDQAESGVGTMVGASLAFLGFLLAFIIGIAVNIFNERRALVVEEANAIGTAYLRAEYLQEPFSTDSRVLLRKYVDTRLAALDPNTLAASVTRSEEIHQELWAQAVTISRNNPSPTTALYVSSLNDVIDIHSKRFNIALEVRVPPAILLGLYLVAVLSMMLIGIQGSYAAKRTIIAPVMMVLILSLVFVLVTDLERSQQGFMQISQQPLITLQQQFQKIP
jgi:hypothetical protein